MEIIVELPRDINKLCRTCMNLIQEEPTAQNCLFSENTPTDLASYFTNITSLQVLLYTKFIRRLFYFTCVLFLDFAR